MSYWHLTDEQQAALHQMIRNHHVVDLGAGDGTLAALMSVSAASVEAVEKPTGLPAPRPNGRYRWNFMSAEQYLRNLGGGRIDTLVLSWPPNEDIRGFLGLAQAADHIVYLGKNTDGIVCGGAALWRHLWSRALLRYVPASENVLIEYGEILAHPRPASERRQEETAGQSHEVERYTDGDGDGSDG